MTYALAKAAASLSILQTEVLNCFCKATLRFAIVVILVNVCIDS